METSKAAAIVNDIILQKEGRAYFTLEDGAALALGRVKGHANTVSVKVKVESSTVLLDVDPIGGGRVWVWDISTQDATEERLKECARESLEGVIRINRWDAPVRR